MIDWRTCWWYVMYPYFKTFMGDILCGNKDVTFLIIIAHEFPLKTIKSCKSTTHKENSYTLFFMFQVFPRVFHASSLVDSRFFVSWIFIYFFLGGTGKSTRYTYMLLGWESIDSEFWYHITLYGERISEYEQNSLCIFYIIYQSCNRRPRINTGF